MRAVFPPRQLSVVLIAIQFCFVPGSLRGQSKKNTRTLTITSTPSGARVEFNGVYAGVTPLQLTYDKSYFEGKKYLWSKFLGEPVTMVTSAAGCDPDSRVITRGPILWNDGLGDVANYYVLESPRFDVQLQCGQPEQQPAAHTPPGSGAQPSEDPGAVPSTVSVTSTPTGCDINVDGKYMGSTPSTLKLAPGDHFLSIEKEGLTPWQRQMTVTSGGSISINATLEAPPATDKNKAKSPPNKPPGSM